jgi:RNA polymerase sigma-70 factor (ECF subfamily)
VYFSQDIEDRALVRQCLAGETQTFEILVERYQRTLFNVAFRMLGEREDAADATQTTFVRVYEKLSDFNPEHRFFSWVYRIQLNECLNVLRARRPRVELVDANLRVDGEGPLRVLETDERRRRVQTAILALSPDLRTVVVLRHFGGMSYDEIADTLGVAVKTVKSRLYTARRRLGELLLGWK